MNSWKVICGDALDRLRELEEASVDAVVTDPPYGIGFMGHEWDQPGVEARRAGKTATFAQGRSDVVGAGKLRESDKARRAAGERDHTKTRERAEAMHAGHYDLSTSALRSFQAWCEAWAREVLRVLKPGGHLVTFGGQRTYHRLTCGLEDAGFEVRDCLMWLFGSGFPKSADPLLAMKSLPRSTTRAEFRRWHRLARRMGGTALKPAYEPIVLARKPPVGTVAQNLLAHGVGALNVDGCRVATDERIKTVQTPSARNGELYGTDQRTRVEFLGHDAGRWPANVIVDEAAAAMLDAQTGTLTSGSGALRRNGDKFRAVYGAFAGTDEQDVLYGDTGGPSRFLYCAKATSAERHFAGRNGHPTVKPVALMAWLARLVTPPGGTVLDPFTGSGTTGIAATREGMSFVGIEREPGYCELARERILADQPLINTATELAGEAA